MKFSTSPSILDMSKYLTTVILISYHNFTPNCHLQNYHCRFIQLSVEAALFNCSMSVF